MPPGDLEDGLGARWRNVGAVGQRKRVPDHDAPSGGEGISSDLLKAMSDGHANAVNAGGSEKYASLFAADAIRMPPGAELEYGPKEIREADQADYDQGAWKVKFTPRDVS
jgi:hypothetical protein